VVNKKNFVISSPQDLQKDEILSDYLGEKPGLGIIAFSQYCANMNQILKVLDSWGAEEVPRKEGER
jgi:hypothetical protein